MLRFAASWPRGFLGSALLLLKEAQHIQQSLHSPRAKVRARTQWKMSIWCSKIYAKSYVYISAICLLLLRLFTFQLNVSSPNVKPTSQKLQLLYSATLENHLIMELEPSTIQKSEVYAKSYALSKRDLYRFQIVLYCIIYKYKLVLMLGYPYLIHTLSQIVLFNHKCKALSSN